MIIFASVKILPVKILITGVLHMDSGIQVAVRRYSRGRPLVVGSNRDPVIQEYILKVRGSQGVVNTSMVIAGA